MDLTDAYEKASKMYKYSPLTGVFLNTQWKPICNRDKDGYLVSNVSGKTIKLHRLAWYIVHGTLPDMLDHINGDRADNRIDNLRVCNHLENGRNITTRNHRNKSGYRNVSWKESKGKWYVGLRIDGSHKFIGMFDNLEIAAGVAQQARLKYFKEFA